MNNIYKLKRNKRGELVAVSELETSNGKAELLRDQQVIVKTRTSSHRLKSIISNLILSGLCLLGINCVAQANGNPTLVHGQASFVKQGNLTQITTETNKTIINWDSFNIGKQEIVEFIQQNAKSSVLNRVLGKQASEILGQLRSNGQVFLINQNGIVFGKEAKVDVASLVASTLDLKDQDYLKGNLDFNQDEKTQQISRILNQGLLTVGENGKLVLVGGNITNNGVLKTGANGSVYLLAGQSISIADLANPNITYKITAASQALNLGEVLAGNKIQILAQQINNNGTLQVRASKNGAIELVADTQATASRQAASIINRGKLKANRVELTADKIALAKNSQISVQQVVVGGYQAATAKVAASTSKATAKASFSERLTHKSAKSLYVAEGASIHAQDEQGKGGSILLWGDQAYFAGKLSTGKKGLIDTSGKVVGFNEETFVANTQQGQWLIDPLDIEIVNATSTKYTGSNKDTTGSTSGTNQADTTDSSASAKEFFARYSQTGSNNESIVSTDDNETSSSEKFDFKYNGDSTSSPDAYYNSNPGASTSGTSTESYTISAEDYYSKKYVSRVTDAFLNKQLASTNVTITTNYGNITAEGVNVTATSGRSLTLATTAGNISLNNSTFTLGKTVLTNHDQEQSFKYDENFGLRLFARDGISVNNSTLNVSIGKFYTQGNLQVTDSKLRGRFEVTATKDAMSAQKIKSLSAGSLAANFTANSDERTNHLKPENPQVVLSNVTIYSGNGGNKWTSDFKASLTDVKVSGSSNYQSANKTYSDNNLASALQILNGEKTNGGNNSTNNRSQQVEFNFANTVVNGNLSAKGVTVLVTANASQGVALGLTSQANFTTETGGQLQLTAQGTDSASGIGLVSQTAGEGTAQAASLNFKGSNLALRAKAQQANKAINLSGAELNLTADSKLKVYYAKDNQSTANAGVTKSGVVLGTVTVSERSQLRFLNTDSNFIQVGRTNLNSTDGIASLQLTNNVKVADGANALFASRSLVNISNAAQSETTLSSAASATLKLQARAVEINHVKQSGNVSLEPYYLNTPLYVQLKNTKLESGSNFKVGEQGVDDLWFRAENLSTDHANLALNFKGKGAISFTNISLTGGSLTVNGKATPVTTAEEGEENANANSATTSKAELSFQANNLSLQDTSINLKALASVYLGRSTQANELEKVLLSETKDNSTAAGVTQADLATEISSRNNVSRNPTYTAGATPDVSGTENLIRSQNSTLQITNTTTQSVRSNSNNGESTSLTVTAETQLTVGNLNLIGDSQTSLTTQATGVAFGKDTEQNLVLGSTSLTADKIEVASKLYASNFTSNGKLEVVKDANFTADKLTAEVVVVNNATLTATRAQVSESLNLANDALASIDTLATKQLVSNSSSIASKQINANYTELSNNASMVVKGTVTSDNILVTDSHLTASSLQVKQKFTASHSDVILTKQAQISELELGKGTNFFGTRASLVVSQASELSDSRLEVKSAELATSLNATNSTIAAIDAKVSGKIVLNYSEIRANNLSLGVSNTDTVSLNQQTKVKVLNELNSQAKSVTLASGSEIFAKQANLNLELFDITDASTAIHTRSLTANIDTVNLDKHEQVKTAELSLFCNTSNQIDCEPSKEIKYLGPEIEVDLTELLGFSDISGIFSTEASNSSEAAAANEEADSAEESKEEGSDNAEEAASSNEKAKEESKKNLAKQQQRISRKAAFRVQNQVRISQAQDTSPSTDSTVVSEIRYSGNGSYRLPTPAEIQEVRSRGVASQALPYGKSDGTFSNVSRVNIGAVFAKIDQDINKKATEILNSNQRNTVQSPWQQDAVYVAPLNPTESAVPDTPAVDTENSTSPTGQIKLKQLDLASGMTYRRKVEVILNDTSSRKFGLLSANSRRSSAYLTHFNSSEVKCKATNSIGITAVCFSDTSLPTIVPATSTETDDEQPSNGFTPQQSIASNNVRQVSGKQVKDAGAVFAILDRLEAAKKIQAPKVGASNK